jgi:hypothetical protein
MFCARVWAAAFAALSVSAPVRAADVHAPAPAALFDCGRHFAGIEPSAGSPSFNLERLKQIFSSRGQRIPQETFVVGGNRYRVDRLLGQSTHQVMEGVDDLGRGVVVKELQGGSTSPSKWQQEYEVLVIEYYRSKGIDVPEILARDRNTGVLVKEYFPGLTMKELSQNRAALGLSGPEYYRLLRELALERKRIREVHAAFGSWLRKRWDQPESPGFYRRAEHLIESGDLKPSNFVYDPVRKRWRLFDP